MDANSVRRLPAPATMVRHAGGTARVSVRDAFLFGPAEAHQISNAGTTDLIYYVIADNPFGTSCYYPDSGKSMVGQPSEQLTIKRLPFLLISPLPL